MTNRLPSASQDTNIVVFVKGYERYIFVFDDDNRAEALRTVGRFASNPELSMNWNDAATVSKNIISLVPN